MTAALEPIGLLQKIPLGDVLRMALLGSHERLSPARALQIGLVTEVLPREDLWPRADELAHLIAQQSPVAVQGTVRAIWEALDVGRKAGIGPRPALHPAGQLPRDGGSARPRQPQPAAEGDRLESAMTSGSAPPAVEREVRPDLLRAPKMAELVARDIRRRIISGELEPGQSLPAEAEMMKTYEIARPTLREALRMLENDQLLLVRQGSHRGWRVRLPDPSLTARNVTMLLELRGATLRDVYVARMIFEPPACRMAAERATDDGVARLRLTLAEELDADDDRLTYPIVAWRFHSELAELSGNATLRGVVARPCSTFHRVTRLALSPPVGTRRCGGGHIGPTRSSSISSRSREARKRKHSGAATCSSRASNCFPI